MLSTDRTFDVAVIGAGIVGLATAWHLTQGPNRVSVVVLDKEDRVAAHQTGRNSGVIHSGIYYRPGSLKAVNCRAGRASLVAFCEKEDIRYEICGKVIVAVDADEEQRLHDMLARGLENGVRCEWMSADELRAREPHVVGRAAILVHDAGIVDFTGVCVRLSAYVRARGSELRLQTAVQGLRPEDGGVVIDTDRGPVRARRIVNCAGLYADRIARLDGVDPGLQIVPFRGVYHELTPAARRFCRHLVYPVPDPAYPFLGVHFTRMVDGSVECGPNAVLALAREGYSTFRINPGELWEMLRYRGLRRLASAHWRQGVLEMGRTLSRARYVRALQRLVPEIRVSDLQPAPSGVRAQALMPDGSMADDFIIRESDRAVHVINAPSPAATAGLEIGRTVAERVRTQLFPASTQPGT